MLCEFATTYAKDPFLLWVALGVLAAVGVTLGSAVVFVESYGYARFEKWQHKTNPDYPSVQYVRNEILTMLKGVAIAVIPPTLSLYLAQQKIGHAYCGIEEDVWGVSGRCYLFLTFLLTWIVSDLYEWFYHRMGHTYQLGWKVHKHHHAYFNPSPFAVIADEPLDQFMRALPLLVFPMLIPINMDMLFATYSVFFYVYGIYLHWGHELEWPDAHHPWLNTSFQHYIHHAASVVNKPYHTGFFFKAWDQAAGSVWEKDTCVCAKCARRRGERNYEAWKKVQVPKYSALLNWKTWVFGAKE